MGYDYKEERERLFTESGQVMLLSIRDRVKMLIAEAGCFTVGAAIRNASGDTWVMLACLDRLAELKEIREVHMANPVRGQDRIFRGMPE